MTGEHVLKYWAFVITAMTLAMWVQMHLKHWRVFKRLSQTSWALLGAIYCMAVFGKPGIYLAWIFLYAAWVFHREGIEAKKSNAEHGQPKND